jgi:hypothetical protein
MQIRMRALLLIAALVGAIGPFALARGTLAQNTATVLVTGEITSVLALTTCDSTADFGRGLTAFGTAPTDTTDVVQPSQRGEESLGQGVFDVWKSSCDSMGTLLQVDSTLPWKVTMCATENTGSAGSTVADGDLRAYYGFELDNSPTYANTSIASIPFTTDCQSKKYGIVGAPAFGFPLEIRYVLCVDLYKPAGTLNLTTTWMVSV